MALAIELAAARWPTLGLDGLTTGLDDQLRILTGGACADDRHRSVRAVLDWSHDLLEPHDRILLRRISVFVAPFTAEAATHTAAFAPSPPPPSPTHWPAWPNRASSPPLPHPPAPATTPWKPSASTAPNNSPRPPRPTPSAPATSPGA